MRIYAFAGLWEHRGRSESREVVILPFLATGFVESSILAREKDGNVFVPNPKE